MPKSSFAEVRRVLVSHMEDEGDQENEKEDEGEDGKQRVERESRRESSNTQHADDTCMKCAPHTLFLSRCQCDTQMRAVQHEKM